MATLVNANADHRFWLKYPDGIIQEIPPKQFKELEPGTYEIASVEMPPAPTPHNPQASVIIVNVGQETLIFVSAVETFELKSMEKRALKPATYDVTSVHGHHHHH